MFEKFVKMMLKTIEEYPKLIRELNHIRNVRNQMTHRNTSNFTFLKSQKNL